MSEISPTRAVREVRASSLDETPRRSRSEAPVFRFPATTIWNNILTCFINEGPRSRHRRQFTYVDDSFTGKAAVDFLMIEIPKVFLQGRTVTRKNCSDLLQKFLGENVFHRYRVFKAPNAVKEVLKDNNTLYVHNRPRTVCRTPLLVLNGARDSNSSEEDADIKKNRRSSSFRQFPISTSKSPNGSVAETSWNRRSSMSHGNLSVVVPKSTDEAEKKDDLVATTPDVPKDGSFDSPSPTFTEDRRTSVSSGHIFRSLAPRLSMTGPSKQRISRCRMETQDDISIHTSPTLSAQRSKESDHVNIDFKTSHKDGENIYDFLPFFKRKIKSIEHDFKHAPTKSRNGRMPLADVNGDNGVQLKCITRNQDSPVRGRTLARRGLVSTRILTEVESSIVWKACLLSRLNVLLKSSDFNFLSWNINGSNIRTNSGTAKSVRFCSERGGYSSYLTRMMHHLEEFPFTSATTNVVVVRDKQEIQIFETLCANLEAEGSVLSGNEAAALLHIVAHVHDVHKSAMRTRIKLLQAYRTGTLQFSTPGSQMTSSGTSNSSISTYLSDYSDCNINGLTLNDVPKGSRVACVPNEEIASEVSTPDYSVSSSLMSLENRRRSDRILNDRLEMIDVYSLPGFKRSPDFITKANEICSSDNFPDIGGCGGKNCNPSPPYSSSSEQADKNPMTENLRDEELQNLLGAFSLVLLTISPATRRKLWEIIRFLSKVSRNHCLQLSPVQENRYVLLQRLVVPCIVPENSPLTAPQAINLVALLMDNERIIFAVDEKLQSEVQSRSEEAANCQADTNYSHPGKIAVQFCQPIQTSNYCTQNEQINDYLLPLLDSIINARMKEAEREKKLRVFRKAHPDVYAVRFPLDKEKDQSSGFLKRLFR